MREIKFRAWDHREGFGVMHGVEVCECCQSQEDVMHMHRHGMPMLQFTGLKDKNGKEIYEGYFLREKYEHACEGEEPYTYAGPVELSEINGRLQWHAGNVVFVDMLSRHEVIGNIYENPELLK